MIPNSQTHNCPSFVLFCMIPGSQTRDYPSLTRYCMIPSSQTLNCPSLKQFCMIPNSQTLNCPSLTQFCTSQTVRHTTVHPPYYLLIGENTYFAVRKGLPYTANGVTHHLCIIYPSLFDPPFCCMEPADFHLSKHKSSLCRPAHPSDQNITRPPAETEQCHQENLSICQTSVRSSCYTLQPIRLTGISPACRLKLSNAIRKIFPFASLQ